MSSKKKATMTLKDFHGGSIPSDLPLPSAPGLMARPSDRGRYDRQTSWENPMGRSEQRLRPGSAGTTRNFDDKTPFLSHSTHIGRNFDEDERKTLDGTSGPRRTVSDDSLHGLPSDTVEHSAAGRVANRPVTTPGSQYSSSCGNSSYAGRFVEVNNVGASSQGLAGCSRVGLSSQNVGVPSGQVITGPHPNAWGARKDTGIKDLAPAPAAWSAPDAALKLAHASALEKVSSGRWHSKQQVNPQTDLEVIVHPESESEFHFRDNGPYNKDTYNSRDMTGGRDHWDLALIKEAEKSLNIDDGIHGASKEVPTYERARSQLYVEANERYPSSNRNGFQSHSIGTVSELNSPAPSSESSDRPKLKLLPRSKPLENVEPPVDYEQVYHQPSGPANAKSHSEPHGNENQVKTGILQPEGGNPMVERPKLNLTSQKEPEQLEGGAERKRNTLFGSARPRELVLKDCGIDNVSVKVDDLVQPQYRSRQDTAKTESVYAPAQFNDRPENVPVDHRMGKNLDRRDYRPENVLVDHGMVKNSDRRDHQLDVERTDAQRRNWQSENWKKKKEFDNHQKHYQQRQHQHQHQQQERPPSPETWRKPVEHPMPASSEVSGPRYGKAASAVELAQAYSKSVSDPAATADRFSGQRGDPSRGQVPFSRLMGPTPRPRVNGY